jgi:hypothetical protein
MTADPVLRLAHQAEEADGRILNPEPRASRSIDRAP